ncbi:MAG: N-acetylmuramoyl-L-alanine amidase family protein [Candidatus Saccharicenans sp.]
MPIIRVSVEDLDSITRVKIASDQNLSFSLRKNDLILTVSFRALLGLKLEKQKISSRFVTSIDLAKSPEAYLLMIKVRTKDFSFSHSSRKSPFELMIDLKPKEEVRAAAETRAVPAPEKPAESAGQPSTARTNESLTQTETTRKQIKTIVIDPGHGGNESGAKGTYGTLEKEITLAVSKKLKEAIERGLKYRVVMTREADISVPLEKRAALANNNKADLFISIHANGSRRVNARGSETFFLSLNATDEEARRLAYFENNSQDLETRVPEKDFDDLKLILWDMAQSAYLKQSSQLAEFVQQELNELLNTLNRGVKQAPFKVLTGAACPAILVEVAFITNPEEEKLLQSEDFQIKVAEAIYRGLNKFLQLYEKP